jgi:hypothetical protein
MDVLDALLSAYEKIGKEIELPVENQDIFKDNLGLQIVLAKLFADILEFHQTVLNLCSGRGMIATSPSEHLILIVHQPRFEGHLSVTLERFQHNI